MSYDEARTKECDRCPRQELLSEKFEANRGHLRKVAYRMLGSATEADDAVQEAWLRLSRAGASDVENLRGWLTTVVARVCLDMLRSRKSRREEQSRSARARAGRGTRRRTRARTPAGRLRSASRCSSCSKPLRPPSALPSCCTICSTCPFDEIASIVGRSPAATRQLASRARRRVQGAPRFRPSISPTSARSSMPFSPRHIAVISRRSLRSSIPTSCSVPMPPRCEWVPEAEIRGAAAVANTFKGRAQGAKPALVEGELALTVIFGGRLRILLALDVEGGSSQLTPSPMPNILQSFNVEALEQLTSRGIVAASG